MLDSFGPWLAKGPTLEMGCFEGAFTTLFAERFADLTVIEAASDLIDVTRKKRSAQASGSSAVPLKKPSWNRASRISS
nr:hypothetical protein GCM10020185_10400 [Pseudomonas brassicacearum subsp. brassicacearum]